MAVTLLYLTLTTACVNETDVLAGLMVGYNKLMTPPDLPLDVQVTGSVTKINELNTKQQTFKINMYFRQQWVDKRLSWDPEAFCGVVELPDLPSNMVWVPDSFFANANEIKTPDAEEYVKVTSDGTVLWSKRIVLSLFCNMNFVWYPFDEQSCETTIESYAFGPDVMNYVSPSPTDRFTTPISFTNEDVGTVASYTLDSPTAEVGTTTINDNEFSRVTFFWEFRRKRGRYIVTAFSQIWLICVTSFVGCFVNPEAAPARVAIALISLLTIINLLSKLTSDVPVVPYITAMDVMYLICVFFVVGNVLEYCFLNYVLTLLKKQDAAVAELKRKRGSASKDLVTYPPSKSDIKTATAELRELFELYTAGKRMSISKDEARSIVLTLAAERGRVYEKDMVDAELADIPGEVVKFSHMKTLLIDSDVISLQVGLTTEHRGAVTLFNQGIVKSSVDRFEAVYRLWAPLAYVVANILWFVVLTSQSMGTTLAVAVPLVVLYLAGLGYTVWITFLQQDGSEKDDKISRQPSFAKQPEYLPMEEILDQPDHTKL